MISSMIAPRPFARLHILYWTFRILENHEDLTMIIISTSIIHTSDILLYKESNWLLTLTGSQEAIWIRVQSCSVPTQPREIPSVVDSGICRKSTPNEEEGMDIHATSELLLPLSQWRPSTKSYTKDNFRSLRDVYRYQAEHCVMRMRPGKVRV